ncbi:DUF58 domain-containing protein [Marivibrio halodurans]|uniref:DUF58 domain-containing protein n=1 Tax=Marivibrio halodurans TaxID=2039722 RepID=A0A8J7SHA7_9PROT|nr:DUF58 domain-containing protein [Marivibrio halodurans]
MRGRAESLGDSLPGLLIEAERVAATVAQGIHGRRRVGMGETFWQYRNFEAHDAASAVDWRRSARSDGLFVRETEWEAAQSVWLWADSSPSMDYRSHARLPMKRDRAELLLLACAALLLRGGERVALMGVGDRPAMGRAALERLTERLLFPPAAIAAAESRRDLPSEERLPRHAQILLFGDFLSPLEDIEARIAGLAVRHVRGVLVQVLDPAEEALPFTGRTKFLGLEAEGDLTVGKAESLRPRYIERLRAHRAALGDIARAAGWQLLVHHTDQPAERALLTLFMALAQEAPAREGAAIGGGGMR